MNYRFNNTEEGVITDKKVQAAVSKLDSLEARGTLIIEAGYRETDNAYCKITGLKVPVNTTGKKVGEAVHDAVKKVSNIVRNDRKTKIDKKEHARKKASAVAEAEEDTLGV